MKNIKILGRQFQVPDAQELGFVAGYQVDGIEAHHLYQAWLGNIRSNAGAKIRLLKGKGKSEDEIAQWVVDYSKRYKFASGPRVRGNGAATPLGKEIAAIARETVRNHLAESNRKLNAPPKGVSKEEWAKRVRENIDRVAQHPDTAELAQKRLAERQKTAAIQLNF